eukprot:4857689-Prymnesium_polylepis.1
MDMSEKWVEKARPSLSWQADKFNTSAPPGYVAGRGRGASGFTKPPDNPPPRKAPGRVPDNDDDDDEDRRRRARLEDDDDDEGAGPSADPADPDATGGVGEDGKLEGDAADTN